MTAEDAFATAPRMEADQTTARKQQRRFIRSLLDGAEQQLPTAEAKRGAGQEVNQQKKKKAGVHS